MTKRKPAPGVSRDARISDEGLARLEAHLQRGVRIGDAVLTQWLRRYGDDARALLVQYDVYHDGLEE